MASLKSLNTIVLGRSRDFRGRPELGTHDAEGNQSLSFAPISMMDVHCAESNEKTIFRFFRFLFYELYDFVVLIHLMGNSDFEKKIGYKTFFRLF